MKNDIINFSILKTFDIQTRPRNKDQIREA